MNTIKCPIPTYRINGIDAKTGGEWPGILPCHFKSSKCIIRPFNHEIFSFQNQTERNITRPLKKIIIPPIAKEFIFRSSTKHVTPVQGLNRNHSVKIYPSSYFSNLNIFEQHKGDIHPINNQPNELKYYPQDKLTGVDLDNEWTKEFRLLRDGAKMMETFKKMTNHQILKEHPIRSSHFNNGQLFTSRYDEKNDASLPIKGIQAYTSRSTNVFEKKFPMVIHS